MNQEYIQELKQFADYYDNIGNYKTADNIDKFIKEADFDLLKKSSPYLAALTGIGLLGHLPSKNKPPQTPAISQAQEAFQQDLEDNPKEYMKGVKRLEVPANQTQPPITKTTKKPIQKGKFSTVIKKMLNLEGGKSDEGSDRGGKTNFGITQRTYNDWKDSLKQPRKDVFRITQQEAIQIYKKNYWDLVKGSQLPHNVAQAIMSMALTDGPQDAIKHTQKILGIPPTGNMGPITVKSIWNATKTKGEKKLVDYIVDKQIQRYQSDEQSKTYGKGWTNRANQLRMK